MAKRATSKRAAPEQHENAAAATVPTHGQLCTSLAKLKERASRFLAMCEHRIDNGTFQDDPELQAEAASLREYLSDEGGRQCRST